MLEHALWSDLLYYKAVWYKHEGDKQDFHPNKLTQNGFI